MDNHKAEIFRKIQASGIIKDPEWLNRLDEPAPLWVVMEALLQLLEKVEPSSGRPYD